VRAVDPILLYQISPTYPFAQTIIPLQNITLTGTTAGSGWCNPAPGGVGPPLTATDVSRYIPLDMCPSPTCNDPSIGVMLSGVPDPVAGFWPCGQGGGSVFDSRYPSGPLITCGALTIVNNALGVWASFTAIFTTPIFIPPNEGFNPQTGKRDNLNATNDHALPHGSTVWDYMRIPLKEKQTLTPEGQRATSVFTDLFYAAKRVRTRPVGPVRREPRQIWSARLKAGRGVRPRWEGVIYGLETDSPSFVEQIGSALWEYDTSDCYDDPVMCACRNVHMESHCHVNYDGQLQYSSRYARSVGGKRVVEPMNTSTLTQVMADEMFTGTTVCDHVIGQCAGMDWSTISNDARNQWVTCMDRYIQGSRLHEAADAFPTDFMYNPHAPMSLINNVFNAARRTVRKRTEERARQSLSARDRFMQRFPRWREQLHNRTKLAHKILEEFYNIHPWDLMFEAIVKADQTYFKYQKGYYGFLMEETSSAILEGKSFMPSPMAAAQNVKDTVADLQRVVWNQPYRDLVAATTDAAALSYSMARTAVSDGPLTYVKRHWSRHQAYREHIGGKRHRARMEEIWAGIYASPMYKWWKGATYAFTGNTNNSTTSSEKRRSLNPFAPFLAHLRAVIRYNRKHPTTQPSLWNADKNWISIYDVLVKRWSNPRWTPKKRENWDKLTRVYYRIHEYLYPGSITQDESRKRFLYNSSCVIVDRTLDITMRVVDYCAAQQLRNTRDYHQYQPQHGRNTAHVRDRMRNLGRYFNETSPFRGNGFFHDVRNADRYAYPQPADPKAWIRPVLIPRNRTERLSLRVDPRVYRSATSQPTRSGPAGWNAMDWLTSVVECITGWMVGAQTDSWFDAFRDWVLNPNTNIQDIVSGGFGNVGLAYWARYPVVCWWPESINCAISVSDPGTRIETALLWTFIVMAIIVVIGAYVFPLITLPFQAIGYPIAAAVIFMGIGFHMSPWCLIGLPAVPTCMADEMIAFLDKWLAGCYSPLIIPPYMIAGDVCPADPTTPISFVSCKDVGVSDGIQNLLYAIVWIFGSSAVTYVLQITTFLVGWWLPGAFAYMEATLNSFTETNATNMQRMTFCFWATSPLMLFWIAVLVFGGIVLAILVPIGLRIAESLIYMIFASPAGPDGAGWYAQSPPYKQPDEGEDKEEQDDDLPQTPAPVDAQPGVLRMLSRRMFFGTPTPTAAAVKKKNQ